MDCRGVVFSILICCLCCQISTGEVELAVRLRGGRTALEGQVEIYLSGSWGLVRDDDWTMEDASVVCRQMGFVAAAGALQTGYSGVWPPRARVAVEQVQCTGKESSLLACKFNNVSRLLGDTETIPSVVCAVEGSIQLVGGCCAGVGILHTLSEGVWLPVCADGWGRAESHVACRQLGYEQGAMSQGVSYGNATFAPKSYDCNGTEYTTQSCMTTPTNTPTNTTTQTDQQCGSMKAVSLQCTNLNSLRPLCNPAAMVTPPNCQAVAPQSLAVAGTGCTSLTLTWSYPRGTRQTAALYRYTLRYRRLGNVSWEYAPASTAGQAAGTGRFSIGGLDVATWYEVQVSAKNELGTSAYSPAVVAQTQMTVPSAPLNISLDSVRYGSAQISWAVVHICNGTAGYEVALSHASNTSVPDRIERLAPVERTGDRVSFTIGGLHPSVQYSASVRALVYSDLLYSDLWTMSPSSQPLVFTTTPIPAPQDVRIKPLPPSPDHPHQVVLQADWTALSDVIGYTVRCSTDGGSGTALQAQVVAPGNTASVLLLANPNTLYNCSVAVVCGSGDCSLKTYVLVQTPEVAPTTTNGTVVFATQRRVPATIPTNLKATLLSSTSNTQTFIFTWEVNPETASDDLLGFILRCHGSSDSSPPGGMSASGIYFENSSQSATPPRSLTVTMATSCSELTCHVAPFNGAGEGVASSGVTLPSSCPEGHSSPSSFLSNPNIGLALLASVIVMAIILLVMVPVTCGCVLSKKGKSKRVYGESTETGAHPSDENYTSMAPSPCPNMWRGEHTMSMRSQKMATLSVNAMEMTRHPYDTIDKASVQNFYDEIRPRVLVPTSSEQPSQGSKVTSAGAKAMSGAMCSLLSVHQSSPRAARHNRGSTEYVEMFSIITPDTPHTSIITPDTPHTSPTKHTASVVPEPIAVPVCHHGNMSSPSEHVVRSEDVTMATYEIPEAAPCSPTFPVGSCDQSAGLDCAAVEGGGSPSAELRP